MVVCCGQVACPVDFSLKGAKIRTLNWRWRTPSRLQTLSQECRLLWRPGSRSIRRKATTNSQTIHTWSISSLYNARYASLCEGGSAGSHHAGITPVGAFCSLCESNYFHFGDSCVECENDLVMSALASALCFIPLHGSYRVEFGALLAISLQNKKLYYRIQNKARMGCNGCADILFQLSGHQQIYAPATSHLADSFLELLSVLDFVSLDVTTWFPPSNA